MRYMNELCDDPEPWNDQDSKGMLRKVALSCKAHYDALLNELTSAKDLDEYRVINALESLSVLFNIEDYHIIPPMKKDIPELTIQRKVEQKSPMPYFESERDIFDECVDFMRVSARMI